MRLMRSWPATVPEGRNYVVDGIERLVIDKWDYRRALTDLDDDLVLLEWDIAMGRDELGEFMNRAAADPDRVRVAPYWLYRDSHSGSANRPTDTYCMWVRELNPTRYRHATPDDAVCHRFGFGVVYLPRALVLRFFDEAKANGKLNDSSFSRWHSQRAPVQDVPIDWDIHAVHLHYPTPEVPNVARLSDSTVQAAAS